MKYIFPRQFGLHNVFTSTLDRKVTVQPFKDYTLREDEIARSQTRTRRRQRERETENLKLPKRLRGTLVSLIQKLQKRHQACAYVELLRHYCPATKEVPSTTTTTPTTKCAMVEFATPTAAVSAFCRAVLRNLIPAELYGSGPDGDSNRDIILRHVDVFVRLGRFENLSLHEVCQGLKITSIKWLEPPNIIKNGSSSKLALSDLRKRTEIFFEFVYYIFDSLLMPLLRSNFYVTESGAHRNRVFYFRHDVWRRLAEPATAALKASDVFEEVKRDRAERILARRALGFSHLRLLPKARGARPIVNLRRRPVKKNARAGAARTELGPSINSLMAPVHSVLSYKRGLRPEMVGSAVSSVQEVYGRLKRFKEGMQQQQQQQQGMGMGMSGDGDGDGDLYFVKLDVQACFDAIPQKRLVQLVERLVGDEDEYRVTKHAEVNPPLNRASESLRSNYHQSNTDSKRSRRDRPRRKFVARAAASGDFVAPYDMIARDNASTNKNNNKNRNNTVFVDVGAQKSHDTHDLLNLLEQHIRNNLVRIGKKYYRQKNGIPQGSVVSSLLCNLFYGEHERAELGFLRDTSTPNTNTNNNNNNNKSLLLRFVDDYLLITADKSLALRFLQVMLDGSPEYGISVGAEKTLVNFDATINGTRIPRLASASASASSAQDHHHQFPYCGTLIDTRTLAISKDRPYQEQEGGSGAGGGTDKDVRVSDTLTVETSRAPGQAFHRKTLTTFRLHLNGMFLDTAHNGARVALRNVYAAFVDAAVKMVVYQTRLRKQQPRKRRERTGSNSDSGSDPEQLMMRIVSDLIRLAIAIVRARQPPSSSSSSASSSFKLTSSQITWLAAMAFRAVLGRRQTRFGSTLGWLGRMARRVAPRTDAEAKRLWGVVRDSSQRIRITGA